MMGAAILATKAALTTGAGLVKVLLPEGQRQVLLQHCPEALCIDISEPEPGDKDEDTALEQLMELSKWADATLVGPGLGTTAKVRQRLCPWLSQHRGPVLLDADALNALSMELGLLGKDLGSEQEASTRAGQEQRSKSVAETSQATAIHQLKKWLGPQTLLTPHRGEAQRLLAPIFGELPEAGLALMEFAQKAAQALGLQLHLKGAPALTAWSSSEVTLNSSGGPLLSTAGSGDVLAGIAAALMAQACPAAIAGALGAFIHGRCADELAKSGQRGHCAGDLCGQIGVVMSKLETGPNSTHS
jgi:NAD(P)H-hydrate epimerase